MAQIDILGENLLKLMKIQKVMQARLRLPVNFEVLRASPLGFPL
jgi:hypothetical protein